MGKRLTSRAEGVAGSELPHTSQELGETSDAEGHAHDDVGCADPPNPSVVEGQDERRGRKGEQATRVRNQRSAIGGMFADSNSQRAWVAQLGRDALDAVGLGEGWVAVGGGLCFLDVGHGS